MSEGLLLCLVFFLFEGTVPFTFYPCNFVGRGQLQAPTLWSLACIHITTGSLGLFHLYFLPRAQGRELHFLSDMRLWLWPTGISNWKNIIRRKAHRKEGTRLFTFHNLVIPVNIFILIKLMFIFSVSIVKKFQ